MGLYASEDEVSESIKALPTFSAGGKYNEAAYSTFVDKRLGRLGLTEKYLREVARENICLNKLIDIVGGGLTPPRSAVQDQFEAQLQTVTLAKVVFNRDDFVEKEDPSEEEIKAFWEANQDSYKSDEQRSISYHYIKLPEESPEPEAAPLADDATDKEKKEAAAKAAAAKSEQREAATKQLTRDIEKLFDSILDSEDKKQPLDFATLVADHGGQAVKTELFTNSTLPEELKGLTLRGASNRNRPLASVIFEAQTSEKEYDLVSDPQPVGANGWIVFKLEEVVEPVVLDYAVARDKARAQLIGENGTEKVKQAAKDGRDAVLALMKDGKDFDTAAREKGFTPVQVGPYSPSSVAPPKDEPSAQQLHGIASGLNAGDVSETIDEQDRSLFIYVDKRELEENEGNALRIDGAMQGAQTDLMIRTFLNWINHQYLEAEVKAPATEG